MCLPMEKGNQRVRESNPVCSWEAAVSTIELHPRLEELNCERFLE